MIENLSKTKRNQRNHQSPPTGRMKRLDKIQEMAIKKTFPVIPGKCAGLSNMRTYMIACIIMIYLMTYMNFAAQQYGVMSGTTILDSGNQLPGVAVTVQGPSIIGKKTAFTDSKGRFRIGNLNVGTDYRVTFTLYGFKTIVKKNVRIELGKESHLTVVMETGLLKEEIVVTGIAPVIDRKSSTNQVNVSKEIIEKLPSDRIYTSIMEMMPGSVEGNNPAMLGAWESDNMYQFDGMDSTDPLTKTWGTAMNFDNFEEVQVIAQGAPAEYGRGTGAAVNVVTKSGKNTFHGTARISLTRMNWNLEPKPYNTNFSDGHYVNETRPAFNLGGPIIKNHIWFFLSYEGRNQSVPSTWYAGLEDARANNPSQAGKAYFKGYYASLKMDIKYGVFSFMSQLITDPITIPEYYRAINNNEVAPGADHKLSWGGWDFHNQLTATLGPNTFMVGRFNMKRKYFKYTPITTEGPRYYHDSGYVWGAGAIDAEQHRDYNQCQVTGNHFMNTSIGSHDIKTGIEYMDINITDAVNSSFPGGEVIYYDETGQTRSRYVYETDVPKQAMMYNDMYTFFVQDKWELNQALTLNLGIRFEAGTWRNHAKDIIMKWGFSDMISPRLGMVFNFGKHTKNKLYANWGKYIDQPRFLLVSKSQPEQFQRKYDYYRGEYYGYPDWTYINTFTTGVASTTTRDDNLTPEYMVEMGIGYEREISSAIAVGLSYINRTWKNKIEDYDHNGDYHWHFANETHFTDGQQDWGATFRKYDAVIFTFKKNRGKDKFQFMGSYTWSKLRGITNVDEQSFYGDDPFTYYNLIGYLGNDIRHMIRFYGSISLPLDITVGLNYKWLSGRPYNNYIWVLYDDGGETGHHGYLYDYFPEKRGSHRYPASSRLDLRIEKKFKINKFFSLSLYADIFNILNSQSVISKYTWIGAATLNGPYGTGDYTLFYESERFGENFSWTAPTSFVLGTKVEF